MEDDRARSAPLSFVLTRVGPYELSTQFQVLRVVALRVVALWLSSVHVFACRASTYTHVAPKLHHVRIDTLMRGDVCRNIEDFLTKGSFWPDTT